MNNPLEITIRIDVNQVAAERHKMVLESTRHSSVINVLSGFIKKDIQNWYTVSIAR